MENFKTSSLCGRCQGVPLVTILDAGMEDVLNTAIADGALLGALSGLDEATATKVMDKLGLSEKETTVLASASEDRDTPTTDAWLRLAKSMNAPASCCLVIASSARSCKAALSAGMRCVVLPDKFTSFQDFSGADRVLDALDKEAVGVISGLLDM